MTLKIAVFAPMPSASVSSATNANPGLLDEEADGVAKVLRQHADRLLPKGLDC